MLRTYGIDVPSHPIFWFQTQRSAEKHWHQDSTTNHTVLVDGLHKWQLPNVKGRLTSRNCTRPSSPSSVTVGCAISLGMYSWTSDISSERKSVDCAMLNKFLAEALPDSCCGWNMSEDWVVVMPSLIFVIKFQRSIPFGNGKALFWVLPLPTHMSRIKLLLSQSITWIIPYTLKIPEWYNYSLWCAF